MKSLALRLTLALLMFTLGVSVHMLWIAYCMPDLISNSPCARVSQFNPFRITGCS